MRYFISIISIFLLSEIHNRCSTEDDITYPKNAEECFNKAITSEDVGTNNTKDYSCCYIKYIENSSPNCVTVKIQKNQLFLMNIRKIIKWMMFMLLDARWGNYLMNLNQTLVD